MKISTRKITVAAILGALVIVMGITNLGMIPIPTMAGRATIMHIPVILGSLLEGPLVGALTGLIFGVYSFLTPSGAIPADPIVRILPRILIGITTYYTYKVLIRLPRVSVIVASIVGTLTNTIGFLGLAIVMGYLPIQTVIPIIPQAIIELILCAVLIYIIFKTIKKQRR